MHARSACCLLVALGAALLLIRTAPAADVYTGPRDGHRWDHKTNAYVKVYVAEPLYIPQLIERNLFVNMSPGVAPPPVTIAPSAYAALQQRESDTARRLAAMEKSLLRIEQQGLGSPVVPGVAPFAAAPGVAAPGVAPKPRRDLPPPIPGLTQPQQQTQQAAKQEFNPEQLLVAAAQVMQRHCAQCHTGDKSRGDAQLFNASGAYELSNTDVESIYAQVKSDKMPKGPNKLAAEEKDILKQLARGARAQ